MRPGDAGDPGRQIMEEPMEKLVEHAVLPLVRVTPVNEAGTYSALSSETSGLQVATFSTNLHFKPLLMDGMGRRLWHKPGSGPHLQAVFVLAGCRRHGQLPFDGIWMDEH